MSIECKNGFFEPSNCLYITVEFTRKKKPSGGKKERRKGVKLPNHIRHEENAAILWNLRQRGEKKKKIKNNA